MSLFLKLKRLYKTYFPKALIERRFQKQERVIYGNIHNTVLSYLEDCERNNTLKDDQKEVLSFLKSNFITAIPYHYTSKYSIEKIPVHYDSPKKLHYTLIDNKKLYWNPEMTPYDIERAMRALNIEQDPQSPHRYLTNDFKVDKGSVFIDVGAAEGNLSLQVIESVKKVYLIEANPTWRRALEATFEPWKEKVTIITKYASDKVSDNEISVDSIFEKEKKIDFIKIDVEGAEDKVINGALNTINNSSELKMALCTYHKQHDAEKFSGVLKNLGFSISLSDGYMLFFYDIAAQEPPYLRKGLIRAVKKH